MSAPADSDADRNGKDMEDNLMEAATLSRALWMLLAGIIENAYPHSVEKEELKAIYQLALEVRDRAEAAYSQFETEGA